VAGIEDAEVDREPKRKKRATAAIPEGELRNICRAFILQSPISTWIIDASGTATFLNEAARRLFGIDRDEEVIGVYNVFMDEELIRQGFMPQIRRVFEDGGSTEFVADYDFSRVEHVSAAHPTHRILHAFLFAVKDDEGRIRYVIIQQEDYTEKSQAERSLAASEARYRELLEDTSDLVWEIDRNGCFTYANPVAERTMGYKTSEVIGRDAFELVIPEDQANAREALEQSIREQKEITGLILRVRHKDGSIRYLETGGRVVVDEEGNLTAYRGISRDVTKRVQAEEALKLSEARYRAVVEDQTELICRYLPDFTLTFVNEAYCRYFGKSREDLIGHSFMLLIPDEDRGLVEKYAASLTRERPVGTIEHRVLLPGGEVHWQQWTDRAIYDRGRLVELQSVGRDITDRKRAEEALRESEERYRSFVQNFQGIAYQGTLDFKPVFFHGAVQAITGYAEADFVAGKPRWDQVVHPDDLPQVQESGAPLRSVPHTSVEREYRILRRDGQIRWVHEMIQNVTDESGVPWFVRGVIYDVTSRIRTEEALRESEERLARLVETTPSGITIVNREGQVTFANAAAEKILGLSRSGITARTYNDPAWRITAVDGEPLPEEELPFVRVTRTGEPVYGVEHAIERSDGTRTILSINSAPLRDDAGNVVGIVSALTDVTERKLAEQRRRELEEHKRDFYRRTILAATEGKLVISERDEIERIAGPTVGSWDIKRGEDLSEIRQAVAEIARSAGMEESRVYDFILAVGEASTNALKHAGEGTASLHRRNDTLIFVVSDRGPGIEALTLPEVALKRGYSTTASLGMGYKAIISIADRAYLATGPTGTTVAIEMQLHPAEIPPAVAVLPDTWAT